MKRYQKRKFLAPENQSMLAVLILLVFVVACGNQKGMENQTPSPTTSGISTSPSPSSPDGRSNSVQGNFSTSLVCSLPQQVAVNTRFISLGGGSWGKWNDSGGSLDFGCKGGKDSIKLLDDGTTDVTAEYGAIGEAQSTHYVSVEYTAFQYAGQSPTENQLRKQYAEFCDKLSLLFFGKELPVKFLKRLLDDTTYSPVGTKNEYAEMVGSGFVGLSSNKNGTKAIVLDLRFFPSEGEYNKFKDL